MAVMYKGKYHRNPSGFHNKVKWLLSKSKWDKQKLFEIAENIQVSREYPYITLGIVLRSVASSLIKDEGIVKWMYAFSKACNAIDLSFVFDSSIRSYKVKVGHYSSMVGRLKKANEHLKDLLYENEIRSYKKSMRVVHKKTGNIYTVITDSAIDCTNERDGTQVVVYCNVEGMWFVREAKEFWQKFEKKEVEE